jgi:hypothetical protein
MDSGMWHHLEKTENMVRYQGAMSWPKKPTEIWLGCKISSTKEPNTVGFLSSSLEDENIANFLNSAVLIN